MGGTCRMAKLVKRYKGFQIKETTSRDNANDKYWIIKPDWDNLEPVWECFTIQEAMDFIDCY